MKLTKPLFRALSALVILPFASGPALADSSAKLSPPSERYASPDSPEAVSFRRHVIPLFSRSGCSGRECHGAFSGQGGYQLSLFGYDFGKDHKETVTDEEDTLRVDTANPEKSLVLTKPTMQEKHKGKERIKLGSWEYNLVLKWIRDGAKNDEKETGAFGSLEVLPKEIVFNKAGDAVQLKVICHWRDGTVEDVTELTRFRTNDESVAEVNETGVVTALTRGDTHIVAFYDNGVQPIPVMLPVSDKIGPNYPRVATATQIDALVVDKLKKVGIVPSEICTDLEFLRRVTLDMTGTLPTPGEIKSFASDPSSNKRAAKIDELLQRGTYAAWWATKLNDFTGNNASQLSDRNFRNEQSLQWYEWIRTRVEKNTPYDELVAGIVLATGRRPGQSYLDYATEMSSYVRKNDPADFSDRDSMPHYWSRQNIRKPEEKALSFAHAFLGVQIQCAQCHKHPFDQWTQQDFGKFQAFFDGITLGSRKDTDDGVTARDLQQEIEKAVGYNKKDPKARNLLYKEIKTRAARGEPVAWDELYVKTSAPAANAKKRKKQKDTGSSRVLTPKILGGDEVHLTEYPDPRQPLMDWMRSKENPYFAKAFVNRVWANYFGRGIVEPADDMNLANPPANAELLQYLADGFTDSGYNMKWLHKTITMSDTYQRSWKANETNELDEKNFSRAILRRMPAEVVTDAITQAVANTDRLGDRAEMTDGRAIGPMITGKGKGSSNYALELFGKPVRLTNCDCERMTDPTLLQTLYTRNDRDLLAMLESDSKKDGSWIAELRRKTEPPKSSAASAVANLERQIQSYNLRLEKLSKGAKKNPDQGKSSARQIAAVEKTIGQLEAKLAAARRDASAEAASTRLDSEALVEEIFLRTVSRPPSQTELAMARKDIDSAPNQVDGARDLLWAMLNTKEFIINH